MKNYLMIFMLMGMPTTFAQSHNHHAGHSQTADNEKSSTQKFKPTFELKSRMDKILGLVGELKGKTKDAEALEQYGHRITETVNDIFKTCKLSASADEAIHPILGDILNGAEELKQGKFEKGHAKIHEAFLSYQKKFSLK